MNLHSMEYLETADDALFEQLVTSWIEANGVVRPGAWRDAWNAYTLSIRVLVWMQQLAIRVHRLPVPFVRRVEESTLRQLAYLEQNLETDIGGNHLIKNIKALIWGGCYFRSRIADHWFRTGLALLDREIEKQVLPDGVHYERSLSYHCQVFADLLECRAALIIPHPTLDAALARMAQVLADLVHPDGYIAQFNDAGLTMAYTPAECLDAYAALTGIRPRPNRHFAYREAGYFGCRTRSYFLIADCGALAPDDLPAHGHCDALSFELSIDRQRVVVDQGVYEYVPGPKRTASRSAALHNTLTIDGADQAEFFGAFRCGRRPRVTLHQWYKDARGMLLKGSHDGYAHAMGTPVHRREINAGRNDVVIHDHLEMSGDCPARVGFLLHPDVSVDRHGDALILRLQSGQPIRITSSAALQVEPAVWWPDMGCEYATRRIVTQTDSGRNGVTTRLHFEPAA